MTSTLSIAENCDALCAPRSGFSTTSLNVNATSAASNGSPSDHTTPCRSSNTQARPPSSACQLVASIGDGLRSSGEQRVSCSKRIVLIRFDSMTAPGVHGLSVGSALVARFKTADVSASWAVATAAPSAKRSATRARKRVPLTFMPDLLELPRQRQSPTDLLGCGANEQRETGERAFFHAVRRPAHADAADDLAVLPEDGGADPLGGGIEVLVRDRVPLVPDDLEQGREAVAVEDRLVGVARQVLQRGEDGFALVRGEVGEHRLRHRPGVQREGAAEHGHEPHALGAVALVDA